MRNDFSSNILSSLDIKELQESLDANVEELKEQYFMLGDLDLYFLFMLGTDYWKKLYIENESLTDNQIQIIEFVEKSIPSLHPQGRANNTKKVKKERSQKVFDAAVVATFSFFLGYVMNGVNIPEKYSDVPNSQIVKQVEAITNSEELTDSQKIDLLKIKLNDPDNVDEIIEIYKKNWN